MHLQRGKIYHTANKYLLSMRLGRLILALQYFYHQKLLMQNLESSTGQYIKEINQQSRRYHLLSGTILSIGFLLFSINEYLTRSKELWLHYTQVRIACVAVIAFLIVLTWKNKIPPYVLAYSYSLLIPLFIIYMHLRDKNPTEMYSLILVYLVHGFSVLWRWQNSLVVAFLLTSIHLFLSWKLIGLELFIDHNGIWALVTPFAITGMVAYRYHFVSREIQLRLELQKRNQLIKSQADELEGQNRQIQQQREMLERAYLQLTDSVRHARRIQAAMRPPLQVIKSFAAEFFILEQAKDTVSGDFFWATVMPRGESIIAVADCTGHGVPAGFMTMMGNLLLNQIVVNEGNAQPAEILTELDKRLLNLLRQNEEGQVKIADGMDIILVKKHAETLTFASARRPLWIFQNGQWHEFKGCPYPIGDNFFTNKTFTQQSIYFQPGDLVYLFSDGYIDQFGTNGKRLTTKRFRELIHHLASHVPIQDQERILRQEMTSWQGHMPQTDDWLIIGMRL